MTIEAQTVEFSYTGDGVSTSFPFPSKVQNAVDVLVGLNDVQQATGFSVAVGDTGATVTFAVAPANGVRVTLLRLPPASQLIDFVNGQTVLEGTLDRGLDKLTMLVQYLLRGYNRSIRLTEFASSTANLIIPGVSARASKNLAFNEAGDLTVVPATANTSIGVDREFSTVAALRAATIPAGFTRVRTFGRFAVGDRGASDYNKLGAAPVPVKLWHEQSADGAWWEIANRHEIHPMQLGALCNNVADDTLPWLACFEAIPPTGGKVRVSGALVVNQTLNIGNGTNSLLVSSRTGVYIEGDAAPGRHPAEGVFPYPMQGTLRWTGASGGTVINMNGPLRGCGVKNLTIDCAGLAGYGLRILGGSNIDLDRVSYVLPRIRGLDLTAVRYDAPLGVESADAWITANNQSFIVGTVNGNVAINVDGTRPGDGSTIANSNFCSFKQTRIVLIDGIDCSAIVLAVADSIRFEDTLILATTPTANPPWPGHYGVIFDHRQADGFPYGCVFSGLDVGWKINENQQVSALGSAVQIATAFGPNIIEGGPAGNGFIYPRAVANLNVGLPKKSSPDADFVNQAAALGVVGFTARSVGQPSPSKYRVSFHLRTRSVNAAWTGTIAGIVSYTDPLGTITQVGKSITVNAQNATSDNFIIDVVSGTAVGVGTLFTGISGSPTYDIKFTFERLN